MQPSLSCPRLLLEPARVEEFPYLYALWSAPPVRRCLFDDRFVSHALARSARLGYAGFNPTTVVAEAEPRLAGCWSPSSC